MAGETARLAILLSVTGASAVNASLRGAATVVGGLFRALGTANEQFFFLSNNARHVKSAFQTVGNLTVKPSVDQEGYLEQLAFIRGSAKEAREDLDQMFQLATRKSANTNDVTQLYLDLLRVGQGALTSTADLETWIMAGKFTGRSATEMGRMVADMYTKMQSRTEIKEPLLQFTKQGLIAVDTMRQIVDMYESGADGSRMFDVLRQGIRDSIAGTDINVPLLSDAQTRFANMSRELRRQIGNGLYEGLRDDIDELTRRIETLFSDRTIEAWAAGVSQRIRAAYDQFKDASLAGVSGEDFVNSIRAGTAGSLIREMLDVAADNFWASMVYGARRYGPEVQKALVPDKLHGLLGLDKAADLARIAAGGEITDKDLRRFNNDIMNQAGIGSRVFWGLGFGEEFNARRRQHLRDYAEGQAGISPLEFSAVDPARIRALTDPDVARALAMFAPSGFAINGAGISGFQYTDSQGNRTLITRAEAEKITQSLLKGAAEQEKAASALEEASRSLADQARNGATF